MFWSFPNGNSVWTMYRVSHVGLEFKLQERGYAVFVGGATTADMVYPPTDTGWCDALVHAARGEPI